MKDSWIIQVEQLKEWKNLILKGEKNEVLGQIDDILVQVDEENKNKMFKEIKTTFAGENKYGKQYSIHAWETDSENEKGISLADITFYENGCFDFHIAEKYTDNTIVEKIIFKELEKILKEILIGKKIKVVDCADDDLLDWINKYNKPLIVTSIEVEAWGLWVKDCPYRIDLSEYILA